MTPSHNHPGYLTAKDVEAIESRHPRAPVEDFERLLAFAKLLLIEKGLDFSSPGAVFDDSDPECGSPDVETLMSDMSLGDRVSVNEGYYTKSQTWVMAPMTPSGICEKCWGQGCEDWAGEDCPSEHQGPVILEEFEELQARKPPEV